MFFPTVLMGAPLAGTFTASQASSNTHAAGYKAALATAE